MPTHIFFDVNETLIDIAPLRDAVAQRLGGGAGQAGRWFATLIEYSLAETLVDEPNRFSDIAAAALAMLVAEDGGTLALEEAQGIVADGLGRSVAWPDAAPGLARLNTAGFTCAALTNSGGDGLEDRLAQAGLAGCFDRAISVQAAGAYKPDARAFAHGLSTYGIAAADAVMVACHPWDLIGAAAINMRTAFVARPGTAWYSLAAGPDWTVADIGELADRLA